MKQVCLVALAIFMFGTVVGQSWAQRGVPIRAPAIRPAPVPHIFPHGARSGHGDSDIDWLYVVLGLVGVAGVVGAGVFAVRAWRKHTRPAIFIRIKAIPPGEAPESIRREWVGLDLPLAQGEIGPRPVASEGLLSRQGPAISVCYIVDGRAALEQLTVRSPDAAAWWRTNAPQVLTRGYKLGFAEEVCERVEY